MPRAGCLQFYWHNDEPPPLVRKRPGTAKGQSIYKALIHAIAKRPGRWARVPCSSGSTREILKAARICGYVATVIHRGNAAFVRVETDN